MQVTLTVVGGKHAGKTVPVTAAKFFIGRAPDCQLRANSSSISRHHCVILVGEKVAAVQDLGSRTGTRVNGEEIKERRFLKTGDRLAIGRFEFDVQVTAAESSEKKAEPKPVQAPATPTVAPAAGEKLDSIREWLCETEAPSAPVPQPETAVPSGAAAANHVADEAPVANETSAASQSLIDEWQEQLAGEITVEGKESSEREAPIAGMPEKTQEKRASSASSQDAAGDALKKFFTRR